MSARSLLRATSLVVALAACGSTTPAPKPHSPPAAPSARPAATTAAEPFRAQRPPPIERGHFEFPTPRVTTLPNGLTVYHVRRPTRVVTLALVVRHGASSSPEGKSGLAALTARMLTEGTQKKPALLLAEAVESLGTTLSAGASRDESSLELTVLPQDASRALALLAEVVTQPAFSTKEFDRVRAEWLDGLRGERQNPQRLAVLAAVRALHGPIAGAPVNGTIRDVERLTVADLRDFHARAYSPDSAALIVVGDLNETDLDNEIARHFRGWAKKKPLTPAALTPSEAPPKTRVFVVDRPGAVQSAIAAVQALPKRSEPGYEARQILGRVLGGLFTSRLNTNLRERHAYTYGASATPVAARDTGTLLVATSVRTDVTAPALGEIVLELQRARDPALGAPLTPAELERARADLVFSLGATLEHPSRIADTVSTLFVHALPVDYHARYPALIHSIPSEAVSQVAQALTPERLLVVIVGDRSKIEPDLRQRGFDVEVAPSTFVD